MIGPILQEIAEAYGEKLEIVKLNTDENPEIAARYGVRNIPLLNGYVNGDARLVIELGLIEQVVGELDAAGANWPRQRAEAMTQFVPDDVSVDFTAYLDVNYSFHEALIDLAGNPLTTMFADLAIRQVMTRSAASSRPW